MADTLQFDLVSPERRLASMEATAVQIPGAEGDLTAMADHEPMITTLRPGVVKVTSAGGTEEYVVYGGFAEITATGASVLAERAMPRSDVTQDFLAELQAEAEARHAKAADEDKDAAAKMLADVAALMDHMV